MARKGLFSEAPAEEKLAAANSATVHNLVAPAARVAPSSLRSLSSQLSHLTERSDELEAQLKAGGTIVEIDPAQIVPPFIQDRLGDDSDPEFAALVTAIAERGQDTPVLLRPHGTEPGRYQLAFGRRRWKACRKLGIAVRAVIKDLSDLDLVIAQGQENSARANLSFIEQATFARRLEEHGYDRKVIMVALSTEKTNLSKMIQIASQVPQDLLLAIGAAPKVGRHRWLEAVDAVIEFGDTAAIVDHLLTDEVRNRSSDQRFDAVAAFIEGETAKRAAAAQTATVTRDRGTKEFWAHEAGVRLAKPSRSEKEFKLTLDNRQAPGFGDYLVAQMDRLFHEYSNQKKETKQEQD